MKNFKILFLSALLLSIYAFQCADDCDDIDIGSITIDVELSSTNSTFSVGDELILSSNFLSDLGVNNSFEYNMEGQRARYNFELFVVSENNLPIQAPVDAFDISSSNSNFFPKDSPDKYNSFIYECDDNCIFDISLSLKKAGYYGIILKDGWFDSQEDCVQISMKAEKGTTNNFSILEEINTQQIIYSGVSAPMITESNSFFFKVE